MKGSNVMGLITEEVEIMINSSNVEYWENKGYDIPRYYNTTYKKWCFKNGTKIHVRTSDLPKYSKAMVLVKYDCCGIEKIIRYEQYAQRNRDGKMYCSHCFSTLLLSGENNPKWRQDYSDDDRIERRYINGYYDFIKFIRKRDNFTCQVCGKYIENGKDGRVHHLNSYNWCQEGRLASNNALYLCNNCHNNFHYKYGYGDNTKEQFYEWYGKIVELPDIGIIQLQTTKKVYCFETNIVYNSVAECAEQLKIKQNGIRRCCSHNSKTYKQHHFLYYDEYSVMSQLEINSYLEWSNRRDDEIKVICLTTGEIFNTIAEGNRKYKAVKIGMCCNKQRKSSGVLNGIPLKWMYLSDFEQLTQEEQKQILNKEKGDA